jgi:hypothetical protein
MAFAIDRTRCNREGSSFRSIRDQTLLTENLGHVDFASCLVVCDTVESVAIRTGGQSNHTKLLPASGSHAPFDANAGQSQVAGLPPMPVAQSAFFPTTKWHGPVPALPGFRWSRKYQWPEGSLIT